MERCPDADLVAAFCQGNDDALEAIFNRYERSLFLYLVGLLRDHHQAEDALQETFVSALSQMDGVDPGHLRGWLFTVAYHEAMLARRKAAVRRRRFPEAPAGVDASQTEPDPLDHAMTREEADRYASLLHRLPECQQTVIRLRLFEGKRFRDIAQTLGCPLGTALARMHQGIKRLRVLGGGADHE
jgi:RNA polymerase sigma-70 factor (ECF subfamily)